ncbi:MAG TPA: DUF3426 domain-containing protein, partial [Thioploca sp.]|nr:DUF3426 domain-containing protein [Thioploca sp.]
MQTQCPHCQTIFRVTAAHLNIAQGHVRCSHCQHIFNATNHLLEQLPEQTTSEEPFRIDDEHTIDFQEDNFEEYNIPELLQEDIYEPRRGRAWKSFFLWGIMVILLASMLAVQGMWAFQRDHVLQHPQIRPWLEQFCYTFLCALPPLPPTRDLNSFEMQTNIAQVHPDIDDVIQFEATFIN